MKFHLLTFLIATQILATGCSSLLTSESEPMLLQEGLVDSNLIQLQETDKDECLQAADIQVTARKPWPFILEHAALGAVIGSATGAVSGSIFGEVGESVASGAAVGTLVGTVQSIMDLNRRTPSYERFVEHCLHQKGYQVIGWQDPE
ncbi:MAG: glycine zipper family protein [Deltaproteobacteria bacterium]|nr:glycine zipper family protein [Deltaproteobacteria bacterium]